MPERYLDADGWMEELNDEAAEAAERKGEMATATKTTPQDIQFALMRLSTFNEFDGDRVADSLIEHDDLWEAWILDRAAYGAEYHRRRIAEGDPPKSGLAVEPIDLIRLRDLKAGYWNVDSLYILPIKGKEKELELLAHKWDADEIDWYDGQDCGRPVLRVWWD